MVELQDGRVRILDLDGYGASQALQVRCLQLFVESCRHVTCKINQLTHMLLVSQENCEQFVVNMQQLQEGVAKYVTAINQQVIRGLQH